MFLEKNDFFKIFFQFLQQKIFKKIFFWHHKNVTSNAVSAAWNWAKKCRGFHSCSLHWQELSLNARIIWKVICFLEHKLNGDFRLDRRQIKNQQIKTKLVSKKFAKEWKKKIEIKFWPWAKSWACVKLTKK